MSSFATIILVFALFAACQVNGATVSYDSGVAAATGTAGSAVSTGVSVSSGVGGVPGPKCYKKIINCCFKWGTCGAKEKLTPISTRCDFKKCGKVCRTSCQFVATQIPKKTCSFQKVNKGQKCGEFLSYGAYNKPVVTPKCVDLFALQGNCVSAYDVIHKQKCETVCVPTCKIEKAECTKTDVFNFAKFCPTLSCSSVKVDGSTSAPKTFVGTDKRLVREIPGSKEIIVAPVAAVSTVSSGVAASSGASYGSGASVSSGAGVSSGAAY